MYSVLASLDEAIITILQIEGIDIGIILKFGLLKESDPEIQYFKAENRKNIRLNVEDSYFFILNSVCRQNHSYISEYAGELILEMFLEIVKYE